MSVRKNSLQAWWYAIRPKTLSGALVPVVIALAMSWRDNPYFTEWLPAILCIGFAIAMQIDANLVNDYFDFVRGVDRADRLGPERACAQGWIEPEMMKTGIHITTFTAALIGLPLIAWGGLEMIAVGILCILFCFLYTTLLSGRALGDVLVLLFFGIIPVCITYYIQNHTVTAAVAALSIGCGLAIDALLVVNNYRDRETDAKHGKKTLITIIGERWSEILYLALGFAATAIDMIVLQPKGIAMLALFAYLGLHILNWNRMRKIHEGKELNKILARTSMSIILYGIATVVCILW